MATQRLVQAVKLTKLLSTVPQGGQIIIDSATFTAVNSIMADIAKLLDKQPDFESLARASKFQ